MYSFLEESGKEALENYFFNCVFSNFGIKPLSVSIDIESTDDSIKILGGKAALKEEDRALTDDVKKYLTEISGAIPWTVS